MNKFYVCISLCVLVILSSCGSGKRAPLEGLVALKGDKYQGGNFKYNEEEYFKTLFIHNITEVVGIRIATQIYEGLYTLNPQSLEVEPCLAEEVSIDTSSNQHTYTFTIKKGVYFHDDPCFPEGKGREIKPSDFKFCFDLLATANSNNNLHWILRNKVVGAEEHYQATKNNLSIEGGVSGIVADDATNTLKITLTEPNSLFTQMLAMPNTGIFPKEAYDKYGNEMRVHCVGTGPFQLKTENLKENEKVILTRNPNYWGVDKNNNPLPYLSSIEVSFVNEQKLALMEFKKGELDMLYKLPPEMYNEVIKQSSKGVIALNSDYKEYLLQISPMLSVEFLGFKHDSTIFQNVNVRKAFNYAIDRKSIVDNVLNGVGIRGIYGFVPPAVPDYNAKKIKGFEFNRDKAQALLAEAGYPEGEGFPEVTLQINAGGGINRTVTVAVTKMLVENLNIKVKIQELPWPQHLSNIESGQSAFHRIGWTADYSDPESFLQFFLGEHVTNSKDNKTYMNPAHYINEEYDSLFYKAIRDYDKFSRYEKYLSIDQKLIDDAVVMPLFYKEDYRLVQPYVNAFYQNPMEYRKFKEVYFSSMEEDTQS